MTYITRNRTVWHQVLEGNDDAVLICVWVKATYSIFTQNDYIPRNYIVATANSLEDCGLKSIVSVFEVHTRKGVEVYDIEDLVTYDKTGAESLKDWLA